MSPIASARIRRTTSLYGRWPLVFPTLPQLRHLLAEHPLDPREDLVPHVDLLPEPEDGLRPVRQREVEGHGAIALVAREHLRQKREIRAARPGRRDADRHRACLPLHGVGQRDHVVEENGRLAWTLRLVVPSRSVLVTPGKAHLARE